MEHYICHSMSIQEKVTTKEKSVKELIENLRGTLNSQSVDFKNNPNDWKYFISLSHTELKLKEVLEYFNDRIS